MDVAYLAIIALIAAIALSFVFKINVGLLAMAFAYLVGKLAGMKDGEIFKAFPYTLFLLVFGVMFLFAIAQNNQALDLLIKKVLKRTGRHAWLIPIVLYVLFAVVTSLGAGPYAVLTLNALLSISLTKELNANPILLLMSGGLGISVGTCSPVSLGGLVFAGLLPGIGYDPALVNSAFLNIVLCETVCFVILYILFRGWKLKPAESVTKEDLPKFQQKQIITLLGILVFIIGVSIFSFNPGSVGIIVGIVLIFARAADEKEIIRSIPWGTMIMLCGVSLLIGVMSATGGVDLIAGLLTSVVSSGTAIPFISFVSGIFSAFAVMSSVVIPTMTSMLPTIIAATGGTTATMVGLITGIMFCGYATGISPLSSGGGIYMAATAQLENNKGGVNMKTFMMLFGIAGVQLIVGVTFAFLGLFTVFS